MLDHATPRPRPDALADVPPGGTGLILAPVASRAGHAVIDWLAPSAVTIAAPWAMDDARSKAPFHPRISDEQMAALRQRALALMAGTGPARLIRTPPGPPGGAVLPPGSYDWIHLEEGYYPDEATQVIEQALRYLAEGGRLIGSGLNWAEQLGYPMRVALRDVARRLPGAAHLTEAGDYFCLVPGNDRRLAPPAARHGHMILSTMKNEAPFILEWLAHHRALGFSNFLIYTNDCDDLTVEMLDALAARGMVCHQPNLVTDFSPHRHVMRYGQHHVMTARAAWLMITDADEFLNIRTRPRRIGRFLAEYHAGADVVVFPWQGFGSNGIVEYADRPVTEQFTACELPPGAGGGAKMRPLKSIFRPDARIDRFGLHRPRFADDRGDLVWHFPNGEDCSDKMNRTPKWFAPFRRARSHAYVNHYPLRSVEAYLVKKERGRAGHIGHDLGRAYFDKWDLNGASDTTLATGNRAFHRALAALMSDPELADLHRRAVGGFHARIRALRQRPQYAALYDELVPQADGATG